jgi:hypothetical protein
MGEGGSGAMVDRFDFTLDGVAASVIGRALDVDIRRFPLRVGPTTTDPVRVVKLARMVYDDLESRKLSVSGELNRRVQQAFDLLAEHRVSVALSGTDVHDGELAVHAVTDGVQALAITQQDGRDQLRFTLFPDDDLVGVLAGALPPTAAAPTGVLTVTRHGEQQRSAMAARRQAEAEFDDEETEAFGTLQVQRVVRSRRAMAAGALTEEEQLDEIFSRPRAGGGYFSASGWGRHGERRTTPPVSWLDTDEGRYLIHTSSDGGRVTARYVPAGAGEVAGAVQQVISAVY